MKSLFAAALLCVATVANAGSFTIGLGENKGTIRKGIGYEVETKPWANTNFSLVPTFEIARLHRLDQNVWQVSAVPYLRYSWSNGVYADVGIGVSFFNHTQLADRNISTAFQFSDNIGIGYRLGPNTTIAYRYSHYSNGGIKRPNPGLDVQSLIISHKF